MMEEEKHISCLKDCTKGEKKLFLLPGRHDPSSSDISHSDSFTSTASACVARPTRSSSDSLGHGVAEDGEHSRISGTCLCKFSAVIYLATCVMISALYVAIYGQSQQYFTSEEVWVPGKPVDKPVPLMFYDHPYTEWISQRWTYHGQNFSNWPSLPNYIDSVDQVLSGKVDGEPGVWLLSGAELYFAVGLGGDRDPQFFNISGLSGITAEPNASRLSQTASSDGLFVITPLNITLLDCSPQARDYCDVVAGTKVPLEFGSSVNAAAVSSNAGSLSQLWVGADEGLFQVTVRSGGELHVENVSYVSNQSVSAVAWRGSISDGQKHPRHRPFFFAQQLTDVRQDVATSGRSGVYLPRGATTGSSNNNNNSPSPDDDTTFGLLVVATREKLLFFDGETWWFEWVSVWGTGLGGVVDGPPTDLLFAPSGELYVSNNVSITRVNTNYTFDRLGPLEGLPYNQASALHYSPYTPAYPHPTSQSPKYDASRASEGGGTLWIATKKGYALFDTADSSFVGYHYGPRWHSGESVLGLTGNGGGNGTVLLTDGGLTVVHPQEWTLERKAGHYQGMLSRHTRPPGIVSDCPLENYDPLTCVPQTTANDGLWTSWLVAAEAFRHHVTGSEEARLQAWALFKGMQFLVNVTGVDGLMARSAVTDNTSVSGSDWHNSSSIPGWQWLGDTSSDEVVGHMFAYPIVCDLVAKGTEEVASVTNLIDEIVDYIKTNDYYLIDVTNRSTRWGVWAPKQINFNQSWADEHGLNSLQILTYLLSAFRVTGKEEYFAAWKELFNGTTAGLPNHYGLNMINQKITFPRDDNFSDDELAFLPFFTYFYTLKLLNRKLTMEHMESLVTVPSLSIKRAWNTVGKGRSSAWTTIYSYALDLKTEELIEDVVWNLRTWPLELVEWPTANSHRLDIRFNPEQDRNFRSHSQSVRVLPANERGQLRWNADPFLLDSAGSSSEMDPGAWLMPYWLARWTKLL